MQKLSQSCCPTAPSPCFCCKLPPGTRRPLQETRGLPGSFPSPRLPCVLPCSTEMQRCLEIPCIPGDRGDSLHPRGAPQGTCSPTHKAAIPLHIGESGLSHHLACPVPFHALKIHFLFKWISKQVYLPSPPLFKRMLLWKTDFITSYRV